MLSRFSSFGFLSGAVSVASALKNKKRKGRRRPLVFRPGLKGRLASGAAVIELFAAVCLIESPTKCKDVSLIYSAEALTPMQCLMQAQPEVAKWIGEHPGWQIKRYSCRPAGQFAKT